MMPPTPALVAFGALIGYPLIQIVAIRARRRTRLRFNALVGELLADERYGEDEHRAIYGLMKESRSSPIVLLAPIFFPLFAIIATLKALGFANDIAATGRETERELLRGIYGLPTTSIIWNDDRFWWIVWRSTDLELSTWPITLTIAFITAGPFAFFYAVVLSLTKLKPTIPALKALRHAFGRFARGIGFLIPA